MQVAIVDYRLCNVDSVQRAFEECGGTAVITASPSDLAAADAIVLPGVGSFCTAMKALVSSGLAEALRGAVRDEGVPFLGICLGMQLIAALGHEGGGCEGLAWLEGEVVRLEPVAGERIPHIGWNEVVGTGALFEGINEGTDFYFVHSYHLRADPAVVAATTPYCGGFVSAISTDNVHAVQFHPEKSQKAGRLLLKNFLRLASC